MTTFGDSSITEMLLWSSFCGSVLKTFVFAWCACEVESFQAGWCLSEVLAVYMCVFYGCLGTVQLFDYDQFDARYYALCNYK